MTYGGLNIGAPWSLGAKRDWENQFHVWGSPPGQREQSRCDNAIREVKAAVAASAKLRARNVRVFAQGSYRNRVNVRQDSDVDVGVVCSDTFFYDLPPGVFTPPFAVDPATYGYSQFKNDLGEALVSHFGQSAVIRGNKAFDIKTTGHLVEADVTPFFEHRRYSSGDSYHEGVELRPDSNPLERVINWPEQHYTNGVANHTRTGDRFKKMVRIIKCLRKEMDEKERAAAKPIPSFLVECLVFNAPTRCFGNPRWFDDVMAVLAYLRENTAADHLCSEWREVSELKYLFRGAQKWTRQQAHEFIKAAEAYILTA